MARQLTQYRNADIHADVIQYSRKSERDVRAVIDDMRAQLLALLGSSDIASLTRRQRTSIESKAEKIIAANYDKIKDMLSARTKDLMGVLVPALAKDYGSMATEAPKDDQIMMDGATLAEVWAASEAATNKHIRRIIRLSDDSKAVRESLSATMVKARKGAAMQAQSLNMAAKVEAQKTAATDASDVDEFIWRSMFDSSTCVRCATMDGKRYNADMQPLDSQPNLQPPMHSNCRCEMEAVTDVKARQAEAEITFKEWLDKKPASYQESFLGKGRYDLYKDGKITLSDLINGGGDDLTLSQLRSKYE